MYNVCFDDIIKQNREGACGIGPTPTSVGYLDNCNYLLENTGYSSDSINNVGFWLERWRDSSYYVYEVTYFRNISSDVYRTDISGVSPAIEVKTSDVMY